MAADGACDGSGAEDDVRSSGQAGIGMEHGGERLDAVDEAWAGPSKVDGHRAPAQELGRDEQAGKTIVPRVTEELAAELEPLIDRYEGELAPLRHFILPGGDPCSAYLHLARATLRRAERRTVSLLNRDGENMNPAVIPYLNRLADLLSEIGGYGIWYETPDDLVAQIETVRS